MSKTVLITGITGQTGSYLAEFLLKRNDTVHGIIRRSSSINTGRIDHIFKQLNLHYGDVTDPMCLFKIISLHKPDVIYHLAAMSHVATSFELPDQCIRINSLGTLNVLEAVRTISMSSHYKPRIYLAGTSEEFGNSAQVQNENTQLDPRSPYGISKEMSFHLGKLYREAYGMHIVIGHCFNHESKRRDIRFVTRKVTNAVARYMKGDYEPVKLGNLDAKRDWTHAADMVRGIVAMTENPDKPKDYVLASGKARSVRDLVEVAFKLRNVDIEWVDDLTTKRDLGVCNKTGKILVKVDPRYYRPCEVDHLCGDAHLAQNELGWKPEISFEDMLEEMIKEDEQ